MPYEPTIWETGDVITAEKLNKIEQAIYALYGGGGDVPAGYVVVAPEQSVTITNDQAKISTVDGYNMPSVTPSNLLVVMNSVTLVYDNGIYLGNYDNNMMIVALDSNASGETDYSYIAVVVDGGFNPVAGTYTVAIYAPDVDYNFTIASEQSVVVPVDSERGYGTIVNNPSYTVPSPENMPENWLVEIDGHTAVYSGGHYEYSFINEYNTHCYVNITSDSGGNYIQLQAINSSDDPMPGTYTVAIYAPEDSGGGGK